MIVIHPKCRSALEPLRRRAAATASSCLPLFVAACWSNWTPLLGRRAMRIVQLRYGFCLQTVICFTATSSDPAYTDQTGHPPGLEVSSTRSRQAINAACRLCRFDVRAIHPRSIFFWRAQHCSRNHVGSPVRWLWPRHRRRVRSRRISGGADPRRKRDLRSAFVRLFVRRFQV